MNGVASKPVQAVKAPSSGGKEEVTGTERTWTRPYATGQWYLSNGKMAYTVGSNAFDVVGQYEKNGTQYMLQTSYSSGWQLYYGNDTSTRGTPPTVQFKFDEAKPSEVTFTVKNIGDGYNLAFGCDTMLGNYITSGGYSDSAALVAKLNNTDQSLKFVAMIGAASEATAAETDPAFVIAPDGNPMFWLGSWSGRRVYEYNTAGGSGTTMRNVLTHNKTAGDENNKTNVVTAIEGRDSGMTISWMNVTGGTVGFKFSVGSVSDTGAIEAEVNYRDENLTGLERNTVYTITYNDGGTSKVITISSNATGAISLAGNDTSGHPYDLIGKSITITHGSDDPQTVAIADRPTAENPSVHSSSTAIRPIEIKDEEVSVTAHSITLSIDPNDEDSATKLTQEYRLVNEGGSELSPSVIWTKPNATTGKCTFSGLEPNTTYTLLARIPATNTAPASATKEQAVRTASDVIVTGPTPLTAKSDGAAHTFPVTVSGGSSPQIAYSTGLSEPYTSTVPSFTKGGKYTVYYRVTQTGSDPIYGSYEVTLDPKITFIANGGTVTLSEIRNNVTAIDGSSNAVNVTYGLAPNKVVAAAGKEVEPNAFAGWYTDAKLTNLYWFQDDFADGTGAAAGAVLSDLTLYARWAQHLSTINGDSLTDVTKLQLQKGGVPVPSTNWVTVTGGAFTIAGVPDDEYDMVLVKTVNGIDQTVTVRVKVENDVITFLDGNIEFPSKNISSKVTVEAGAPAVVVSGLAQETLVTKAGSSDLLHWDFTGDALNPRSTLELIFSSSEDMTGITQSDAEHLNTNETATYTAQTAISSAAGSRAELEFYDISVIRKDEEDGQQEEVFQIGKLKNPVEIAIPYTAPAGYTVKTYRYHVPEATVEVPDPVPEMKDMTRLSARRSSRGEYRDGEFFVGDGVVYVYTSKFSTYAIAAIAPAPSNQDTGRFGGSYSAEFSPTIQQSGHGTVSVSPTVSTSGQKVTITVKPDEGSKLDSVTVTDANGKSVTLTKVNDTTYTYIQPNSKVTINVTFTDTTRSTCPQDETCPISAFIDADPTEWYHDGVHWALENGVMGGWDNPVGSGKLFGTRDSTSRAMVATMLWRLDGSPVVDYAMNYSDVDADSWYIEAVRWATSAGIITGYDNPFGSGAIFNPNSVVTREQLVTMLYRYAQYKSVDVSVGEDTNILSYGDAFDVSTWAMSAMQWAVGAGVVNGTPDASGAPVLAPSSSASRAVVATMLMRYCTEIAR